jgi:hypothetical protein
MRAMVVDVVQEYADRFYWAHGKCCAGCDWWHSISSTVGECTRSAPVPSEERWDMLGIESCSLRPASGHAITPREHLCGEFKDDFDWRSLPLPYRIRIGAPL